jgi:hypothetical protein
MIPPSLLETIVERMPLRSANKGYSGARLERVVLSDGAVLIVKHISPESDVAMRLTHDTGRAAWLWTSGLMGRFPPVIDHATVAVEAEGDGWAIIMRDVSDALLPNNRLLTRAESYRILEAATRLHTTFRGQRIEGLCTLTDHLSLFLPSTALRERGGPLPLFRWIARGWELFQDVVPRELGDAISAIHARPSLLAEQLERCELTLIHGDLWLSNIGLFPDRVVMLDWGAATAAPPAFEFTMYLTGNWSRIAAEREQLIDDFRNLSSEQYDERAMQLAFIATFTEFGWNKALDVVEHPDAAIRAREAADLAWWVRRVSEALETWSPV